MRVERSMGLIGAGSDGHRREGPGRRGAEGGEGVIVSHRTSAHLCAS
jgi:hypothetical protein